MNENGHYYILYTKLLKRFEILLPKIVLQSCFPTQLSLIIFKILFWLVSCLSGRVLSGGFQFFFPNSKLPAKTKVYRFNYVQNGGAMRLIT